MDRSANRLASRANSSDGPPVSKRPCAFDDSSATDGKPKIRPAGNEDPHCAKKRCTSADGNAVGCAMDFTAPFALSDVTFVVEEKQLYSNRAFLAMHSPYFESMFSGAWKESSTEKGIELPGKKFDEVLAMLKLLKRDPRDKSAAIITDDNIEGLLKLADEFDLRHVAGECEQFVLAEWRTRSDKALKGVMLANKYALRDAEKIFIPLAACRQFSDIRSYVPPVVSLECYAAILHCHCLLGRGSQTPTISISSPAPLDVVWAKMIDSQK